MLYREGVREEVWWREGREARVVAFGSVKDESRLDYELCGDKAVEYIVNHHSNSRTGSVA